MDRLTRISPAKLLLLAVLCLLIPISVGCGSSDDERDAALTDSSEEKASTEKVEVSPDAEEVEAPEFAEIASSLDTKAVGTTTFGANLSRTPNVTHGCESTPPPAYPTFARSCTWFTAGNTTSTGLAESNFVPGYSNGRIVSARVRVGPTTGQMQFVVLRYLKHPDSTTDEAGCCSVIGASSVFTPSANSVTEVPMNVAVRNETDSQTGIGVFDALAISVLSQNVPIPAYDSGDRYSQSSNFSGVYYPAVSPGTERADQGGWKGYQVLINGEFSAGGGTTPTNPTTPTPTTPTTPSGGGTTTTPGGTGGGAGSSAPALTLGTQQATVKGTKFTLPFKCNLDEECFGYVKLQQTSAYVRSGAGEPTTRDSGGKLYASETFEIPAGQSANVPFKLYTAPKALFKKKKSIRVTANVEPVPGEKFSQPLTLKQGK